MRQRGFVLLVVLMSVGLLALLTAQLTGAARSDAAIALRLRDVAVAEAAAEGGVAQGVFALLTRRLESGQTIPARIGTARLAIQAHHPSPAINPNTDPPVALTAELRDLGIDPSVATALATAMRSWHSVAAVRPFDDDGYRRAGLTYGPPRSAFASADEVGLVLGMTPELFARLRPFLNVFGGPSFIIGRPGGVGVPSAGVDQVITVTAEATSGGAAVFRSAKILVRDQPEAGAALYRILDWSEGPDDAARNAPGGARTSVLTPPGR